MKKRGNRKKLFIVAGITIVLVVLILLSAPSSGPLHGVVYDFLASPVAVVQNKFSQWGSRLSSGFNMLMHSDEIEQHISELEQENAALRDAVLENISLKRENEELKGAIIYREEYKDYRIIGGRVISGDINELYNVYTISCGASDGVKEGCFVVTSDGLAGVIQAAGPVSSKVISIVDEQNKIIVRTVEHNELLRVTGASDDNNGRYLRVDRIPKGAILEVGDTLVSSDSGQTYPSGVKVGRITKIVKDEHGSVQYAIAEPFVRLRTLDNVFVMAEETAPAKPAGSGATDGK